MSKECKKIKQFEQEISQMKEEGLTYREIKEKLNRYFLRRDICLWHRNTIFSTMVFYPVR